MTASRRGILAPWRRAHPRSSRSPTTLKDRFGSRHGSAISWPRRPGTKAERAWRNVHFATIGTVEAMLLFGGHARAPPTEGMQMTTLNRRILMEATLVVILHETYGINVNGSVLRHLQVK